MKEKCIAFLPLRMELKKYSNVNIKIVLWTSMSILSLFSFEKDFDQKFNEKT